MNKVFLLFRPFVLLLAAFFYLSPAHALPYSALYAFGDSLSDVGNDLILTNGAALKTPDPTYYSGGGLSGRFTNGANYLDGLASDLGLAAPLPSLAGGTIYAYGGARTSYAAPGLPAQAAFDAQIDAYTAKLASTSSQADPNALYVLWIGANNMADAIGAGANAFVQNYQITHSLADAMSAALLVIGQAISQAMSSIGHALAQLMGLGAQHFLVPNLPDLALTPMVSQQDSDTVTALAHGASVGFNQALAGLLDLPPFATLDIRELDVFASLNAIVFDPASYGMSNVVDACYTGEVDGTPLHDQATPSVCNDPASQLFWDYEHPTAATHAILAGQAFDAAIPEPPAIMLVLVALAGLMTALRRRQRSPAAPLPQPAA